MSGAYVGLTSVVLVDLLGMERLTNAFGLLLMFQGIASILGPPICGKYDVHESMCYFYDPYIYLYGMCLWCLCDCVFGKEITFFLPNRLAKHNPFYLSFFPGVLFDKTGSYDYSFLLAGSMIAISGLMLFFIPCIWRIQARKLAKQVNSNTVQ